MCHCRNVYFGGRKYPFHSTHNLFDRCLLEYYIFRMFYHRIYCGRTRSMLSYSNGYLGQNRLPSKNNRVRNCVDVVHLFQRSNMGSMVSHPSLNIDRRALAKPICRIGGGNTREMCHVVGYSNDVVSHTGPNTSEQP